MEERKNIKNADLNHNPHPEQHTSAQVVLAQDAGWCSAEFSSGCILEDE